MAGGLRPILVTIDGHQLYYDHLAMSWAAEIVRGREGLDAKVHDIAKRLALDVISWESNNDWQVRDPYVASLDLR